MRGRLLRPDGASRSPQSDIPEWNIVSPNHNPRYRRLVVRLRAARKAAGLTQAQVAAAMRQPQSFISKMEANQRTIDPVEFHELARLYGKTMHELLEDPVGEQADSTAPPHIPSNNIYE